MSGDLRPLYLGWLRNLTDSNGFDEDADAVEEPPVPPGLSRLSRAQQALAEFLMLDEDLVSAAGQAATGRAPEADASPEEWTTWIRALPPPDKDEFLFRLVDQNPQQVRSELLRRFRAERLRTRGRPAPAAERRRTVEQLRNLLEEQAREREQAEARRREAERERRREQEAAERAERVRKLAAREPAAWREVEAAVHSKKPAEYDRAVALLLDLRALAEQNRALPEFRTRVSDLRERHARKSTFLERLTRAGL
jgi:hypothetical protein